MSLFPVLLIAISMIWIAFEIWLVVRDRTQNKGKTAIDRGTRYFNFIAITFGMTAAAILSGNSKLFFPGGRSSTGFWIGLCVMLLGLGLRVWAVVALGASFRTTVETHADQRVIQSGPYRLMRHPSYSGLILTCCGYGIAVQNWLSLAFAVVPPLIALLYRMRIEEAALVTAMGPDYQEYQSKTRRLIPWVW
jgi:protein-S-isoprenylcysteine O-methyltransferase Ste14